MPVRAHDPQSFKNVHPLCSSFTSVRISDTATLVTVTGQVAEDPESKSIQKVQLLLDAGADMNNSGLIGQLAISSAAGNGHGSVVELLLDAGTDMNIENRNRETALFSFCA
jgi:hypothetical protein